jgi:cytochrome c oxidase cbb3-type subunit 3
MSSACKSSTAPTVTTASKASRATPLRGGAKLIGAFVLATSAACAGPQMSEPDVDVAPPVVETNVGPIPGVGEAPAGFEPIENPFARDPTALADGRRFFTQYNCAGCHGDHGGGGMGPSLRDEVWLYGGNHAQIANSIAEGRAYGMPAWRARLTGTQIWQITAYLKSMRTDQEPDKPQ